MSYNTSSPEDRWVREERKKRIKNIALGMAAAVAVVAGSWSAIALDRVSDGNFGIGKSWSGLYQDEVIKEGFSFNYMTKVLEIDGKNNIVQVTNVRPKDKDGILLEDMDYNVIYNVNPELAVSFLREQPDLVRTEDGTYALGGTYVTKFAARVATEVIRDFPSVALLDSPGQVEEAIQNALQDRLDNEYGEGLFEIANINLASVKLSPVIEQRIQNIAAQDAAAAEAQAQARSLDARTTAELAEAQALKDISGQTGVSVSELLEIRRIRALQNLNGVGTTVTVAADRKPEGPGSWRTNMP